MASPLGLSTVKRYNTRQRAKRAAMLGVYKRASIHYTQGARRWEGIAKKRRAASGQFPNYADCSSFATWCLWDATRIYNLHDFVNGHQWRAGYTGTMTQRGTRVSGRWLLVGDCIFYGGSLSVPGHVAIVVQGGPVGRAKVVSFGSNPGPLLLAATYRPITQIRRYVR